MLRKHIAKLRARIVRHVNRRVDDLSQEVDDSLSRPKRLVGLILLRLLDPGFVQYFYLMIRNTRTFLWESRNAREQTRIEDKASIRRSYRRIVLITAAVTAFGCIGVPCTAPWLAVWLRGITPADALSRMVLGFILSFPLLALYLLAGASVGCRTAPSNFLRSRAGERWMALLGGTRSVFTHRVFCVLCALTGFGVMFGVGAFLVCMASPAK